jgi:hypothetical protein
MNKLLTDKGQLCEHIYGLLKTFISGSEGIKIKNVVLTSDNLEVVALLDKSCFIVPSELKDAKLEKVGWTTALFASLGYEMIISDLRTDATHKIKPAWKNAHKLSGVKVPDVLRSPSNVDPTKKGLGSDEWSEKWQPVGWGEIDGRWNSALNGIGVIQKTNEQGETINYLELWRAKTDLPGYIVCEKNKREVIRRVWRAVSSFKIRPQKNLSILLEADPGVGKSYLAEKLATQLKLPFIKHDISQMVEREELLDLFDVIAAKQAEQDLSVLVFVDEINATLGGSPVYGGFLTPLEAGKYMRHGRLCKIKPCIWMFAGTPEKFNDKEKVEDFRSRLTVIEQIGFRSLQKRCITPELQTYLRNNDRNGQLISRILEVFSNVIQNYRLTQHKWGIDPVNDDHIVSTLYKQLASKVLEEQQLAGKLSEDEKRKLKKFSNNFMREDHFLFNRHGKTDVFNKLLKELAELDHQTRLEQVYMGVEWVNDAFNDVQKIDYDILSFFYLLDPSKGLTRIIKRLSSSLENIQYGKAHKGNCTGDLWRKNISDLFGKSQMFEDRRNIEKDRVKWVHIQLD